MTESAARLVDEVLPRVPVRQWVLSLPHRLRYLLAWNHVLARAVLGVCVRVLLGFQHQRLLERRGLDPSDADPSPLDPVAEEAPALAGISRASIQGRVALGPRAGARVWRAGDDPDAPWVLSTAPRHAHLAGFDRHANVEVPAADRTRLEQLCRMRLIATVEDPDAIRAILAALAMSRERADRAPPFAESLDASHAAAISA